MTEETQRSPQASERHDLPPSDIDPSLETLREILFSPYRQKIVDLEAKVDELEHQVADEDALIALITPVLGEAIRRKIRDAREEMIEALYPIIGQLIARAVSEAISDLSRKIDAQVRTSFSPRTAWWRLRARLGGASDAEMMLRTSLPFEVTEVFLIHRETGLLLRHLSSNPASSSDSDLISSMLTAIRDFSQDTFGRGQEGDLDEIEYGERHILIETAQHAYMAVVVNGVEPPGFRTEMRERIIGINHTHEKTLRRYDGNSGPLASTEPALRSLMTLVEVRALSSTQKRFLAGALVLTLVCLIGACLAGQWVWHSVRTSRTPTADVTSTPASMVGLMTGNVWLHQGPADDSPRLGLVLERGQMVDIMAVYGNWYRVRWAPEAQSEMIGWVSADWVGTLTPLPEQIITPTAAP